MLYIVVAGPLDWTGAEGVVFALLLLVGAAVVGHFVVVALARQRHQERMTVLQEVARGLGGGDLGVTAPEGDDDLGSLGRSLNAMSARTSRLLQAQRDLLSGVSHELRSPIARIDVSLELLHISHGANEEDRELLDGIREETALLERHISRLLEAQRVSTRRVLLKRRPLVLDELVGTVMRRERLRLEKLGWTVQTVLGLGDAQVLGDENALDRVLSTLVENAIQHAGHGPDAGQPGIAPSLLVQTETHHRGALVRVMDRGPGLTEEQCARAFEPFFRIDHSRSTKTGGTGLGMYLARQIAEAHRGSARAWPRDGGGLVVELRIPMRGQKELKETLRVEMDAATLGAALAAGADEAEEEVV